LLPCVDSGRASAELAELLEAERERITAAIDDLLATRESLDRIIDITNNPTPEHCPGLREPTWSPYNPAI